MRWWPLAAACILIASTVLVQGEAPVADDTHGRPLPVLPYNAALAAAVWTGRYAYVFGGSGNATAGVDTILRFDPAEATVKVLQVRLPDRRYGLSAVWDGRYAYVLGGQDNNPVAGQPSVSFSLDILRFDPATETLTRMHAQLPWHTFMAAAAWDGS